MVRFAAPVTRPGGGPATPAYASARPFGKEKVNRHLPAARIIRRPMPRMVFHSAHPIGFSGVDIRILRRKRPGRPAPPPGAGAPDPATPAQPGRTVLRREAARRRTRPDRQSADPQSCVHLHGLRDARMHASPHIPSAPGTHCHCRTDACFEEARSGLPYLALAALGGRAGPPGDQGSIGGGPPPRRRSPDPNSARGPARPASAPPRTVSALRDPHRPRTALTLQPFRRISNAVSGSASSE